MWRFLAGILVGVVMALGYVRFGVELPGAAQLPDKLRGNIVASAIETDLYDLDRDLAIRRRALEVYLASRPADAARADAEAGHPLLGALVDARARREARQLASAWPAYDEALGKAALREALERKHATRDALALKQAMLLEALDKRPFLKRWLEQHGGPVTAGTALGRLQEAARLQRAEPGKR